MASGRNDPMLHIGDTSRRERLFMAVKHVDKIIDGDATAIESAPWHDSDFRQAVVQRLMESEKYREEARKLAIVKEVFGGSK
jgi:hypothetical protein